MNTNDNTNNMSIDEMLNNPVKVDHLDENTEYVARLEFHSVGDSSEVRPVFKWTHTFPDDYEGEEPSSYLAMRDMMHVLNMMLNTPGTGMRAGDPDSEDDFLDGTAIDELDIIEAQTQTKN